jgi:hypothetical protein
MFFQGGAKRAQRRAQLVVLNVFIAATSPMKPLDKHENSNQCMNQQLPCAATLSRSSELDALPVGKGVAPVFKFNW